MAGRARRTTVSLADAAARGCSPAADDARPATRAGSEVFVSAARIETGIGAGVAIVEPDSAAPSSPSTADAYLASAVYALAAPGCPAHGDRPQPMAEPQHQPADGSSRSTSFRAAKKNRATESARHISHRRDQPAGTAGAGTRTVGNIPLGHNNALLLECVAAWRYGASSNRLGASR